MKKKTVIILSIIALLIIIPCVIDDNLVKLSNFDKKIKIKENIKLGTNIFELTKIKDKEITDLNYQKSVTNNIKYLLNNNKYTFDEPLVIYDPYKTNMCSLNIYFNSNEYNELKYTIHVEDKTIPDYTNVAKKNRIIKNRYGYYVTGLVLNHENIVKFELTNKSGKKEEKTIQIKVEVEPDLREGKIDVERRDYVKNFITLDVEQGTSKEKLSDGLYSMNSRINNMMAFYDNNGILRANLLIDSHVSFRLIEYEDSLIYPYDKTKFIRLNKLGEIMDFYEIKGYTMNHDYNYNNDKLYVIAHDDENKLGDLLLTVNLKTKEVKPSVQFEKLLSDVYEKAKPMGNIRPKEEEHEVIKKDKAKRKKGSDWFHANSVAALKEDDILISSRELSAIIYIENVTVKPEVKYIISEPTVFKDTQFENLVLKKESEFFSQAGQHGVEIIPDLKDDNSYYLTTFNNKVSGAATRPDFDWSVYGDLYKYDWRLKFDEPRYSEVMTFHVNEKTKSYDLVNKFNAPYSGRQSSVSIKDNNYIVAATVDESFIEYDSKGEMIAKFKPKATNAISNVVKHDFKNIWFER